MTRPPRRLILRRPSLAETVRSNQRALDLYASLSDRPTVDLRAPKIRAARQPAQSPRPKIRAEIPLERDVQRAVLDFLRRHPAIAFAGRLNSGTAMMETGRPIWFHTLGAGASDIIGAMRRNCAWLAIEVKRPGGKPTSEQLAWLQGIRDTGGCAGWATCVEDVQKIISDWISR